MDLTTSVATSTPSSHPPRYQDVFSVLSNNDSNASLDSYLEETVALGMWKVGSPLLLVVGTVGNVLSIMVLSRKRLRRITTMFYLAVLAFADLAVLYTGLLRLWMDKVLNVYIRLESDVACRVHLFCVYFSLGFSVWTLVAVTADRCLWVSAPFTARRWCSLKQARIVVAVIAVALFLINMHYLWTVSVIYHGEENLFGDETSSCYTSEDPSTALFVEKVWPWIDFCVVCLIPFIIMLVLNSLIIRHLLVTTRRLRAHSEKEFDACRPDNNADPAGESDTVVDSIQNSTAELDSVTTSGRARRNAIPNGSANIREKGSDAVRGNGLEDVRENGPDVIRGNDLTDDTMEKGSIDVTFTRSADTGASEECDDVFDPPSSRERHSGIQGSGITRSAHAVNFTGKNVTIKGLNHIDSEGSKKENKDNISQEERGGLNKLALHKRTSQLSSSEVDEHRVLPPVAITETAIAALPSRVVDSIKLRPARARDNASPSEGQSNPDLLAKYSRTQSTGSDRPTSSVVRRHFPQQVKTRDCEDQQDGVSKKEEVSSEKNRLRSPPQRSQHTEEQGVVDGCSDPRRFSLHIEADEDCTDNQQNQSELESSEDKGEGQQQIKAQKRPSRLQNHPGQQEHHQHEDETETRKRPKASPPITSSSSTPPSSLTMSKPSPERQQLENQQNGKRIKAAEEQNGQPSQPANRPRLTTTRATKQLQNGKHLKPTQQKNGKPIQAVKQQNGDPTHATKQQQNGKQHLNPTKQQNGISIRASSTSPPPLPTGQKSCLSLPTAPAQRQLNRSLTVMLLTVNALFYLLTAPIVVFMIGYSYWAPEATGRSMAQLSLGWAFVNLLQYTNNSVHFFLYCLTGPRFRQELRAMCSRSPKRRAMVSGSVH